ncbi:MAG: hypothetical protein K2X91_17145, partial [Thermoleophilia bacterium]|nr:hypothetical protein [Thermoleophilia bacterium]
RLHVAYRVWPYVASDQSEADSRFLALNEDQVSYEEPAILPSDDELSLLLSFRLEMPLHETIPIEDLRPLIRAESPLLPIRRAGAAPAVGRPLCLLSLIEPTPAEADALASFDVRDLLVRLKSFSKQIVQHPDPGMPAVFASLLYTTAIVAALVRHGQVIHSLGPETLARNVRWFLRQPWLDGRLGPIFREALVRLEPGDAA